MSRLVWTETMGVHLMQNGWRDQRWGQVGRGSLLSSRLICVTSDGGKQTGAHLFQVRAQKREAESPVQCRWAASAEGSLLILVREEWRWELADHGVMGFYETVGYTWRCNPRVPSGKHCCPAVRSMVRGEWTASSISSSGLASVAGSLLPCGSRVYDGRQWACKASRQLQDTL